VTVLKQSELNWIREVVTGHQVSSSKLSAYAEQVQDPQLKTMFSNASTEAKQSAQKLVQMIG
jgi:spore coat protein CotF